MKTKLLIGAICLLLAGCAEKPTYEQAQAVRAKYPGCELKEGATLNPSFYVRTANGSVLLVYLSSETQGISNEWIIFPPSKPLTP